MSSQPAVPAQRAGTSSQRVSPVGPVGPVDPAPASVQNSDVDRPRVADTPRLLNRLQAAAVAACVLFGILAAVLQIGSWQANGRAADNTEQVVRVQEIESSLLRADALATNGFLTGGIEPAQERADYDATIDSVLTRLTDAAEAQPADRAALEALSDDVSAYTNAITQARANNRQQNPVGSEYLGEAGASLRADALPVLDALISANQQRATDEMGGHHPSWLLLAGVLVVVVLVVVNRALARRFHRRVNVGLGAAALVVLVVTLLVVVHAGSRSRSNDDVRQGPYAATIDEAAARTAADNAKAYESLRLINRGSGPVSEPLWQAQAAVVEQRASRESIGLWNAYVKAHQAIVAADDAGNYPGARNQATSDSATGSTALLDAFDSAAQSEVTATGAEAASRLRGGGALAILLAVLSLLGGLVAAGAATLGINRRRQEYS